MDDLYDFFSTQLILNADRWAGDYLNARPFPHMVKDNFLPTAIADRMLDKFPDATHKGFSRPDSPYQTGKLGRTQKNYFRGIDPWLRTALSEFNSMPFLDFLEKLTGIPGLIPDPHFVGGAFHQIVKGGKLDIHADFNIDRSRHLRRRVNLLFYLNRNWKPEYNGNLELWDKDMQTCEASIAPEFNRCVIFNTTSTSFHGHPSPLSTPDGVTRKSIALYYYSNDPYVFKQETNHATLWQTPANAKQ